MKKIKVIALVVAIVMALGVFAACAPAEEQPSESPSETTSEAPSESPSETTSEAPAETGSTDALDLTNADFSEVGPIKAAIAQRDLANPYAQQVYGGGEVFVEWATAKGAQIELQALTCDGDNQKQINDIQAYVQACGPKGGILYIDPNEGTNCAAVAEACEAGQIYWSSVWNMATGYVPTDYEYYVIHQTGDGVTAGHDIAVTMFEAMGGKGNIVSMEGIKSNGASIDRCKGLDQALSEYPDVKELARDTANWSRQEAMDLLKTWLPTYGSDLQGVWCANDEMAVGAVQALKDQGLNGQVYVVGVDATPDAIAAIEAGDMLCSASSNGYAQGAFGLAYPYAALAGIINPSEMTQEQRVFLTKMEIVSTDNVADYKAKFIDAAPSPDAMQFTGDDLNLAKLADYNIGPAEIPTE